jgi:hypothetical protein
MFKVHQCFKENHKFEARYDVDPQITDLKGRMSTDMIQSIMETSSKRTYVQDVCVYCGKVSKREE